MMKKGVTAVVLVALVVAVLATAWWLFQSLWNYVVAGAFGGPSITYWQAAGACCLLGWLGNMFRGARKSGE